MKNKLGLLCIVGLCASLALAQAPEMSRADWTSLANPTVSSTHGALPAQVQAARASTEAVGTTPPATLTETRGVRAAGATTCGANGASYLCGQSDATTANTWNASDWGFTNCVDYPPPNCKTSRIVTVPFPPPGEPTLTAAVGIVRLVWHVHR